MRALAPDQNPASATWNPTHPHYSAPRLLFALALLWFLAAVSLLPPIANAATIAVTTTVDEHNSDGDCSLREALAAANDDQAVDGCAAGSGADIINLPAGIYRLRPPRPQPRRRAPPPRPHPKAPRPPETTGTASVPAPASYSVYLPVTGD